MSRQSIDHIDESILQSRLAEAARHAIAGATYRHYKGNYYNVIGLAILEATNEVMVIYEGQYGKHTRFARPLNSWLEHVEHKGLHVPRFAAV